MSQYNSFNVKLLTSHQYQFKVWNRKWNRSSFKLPSNMIHNSDDEINFPYKLLLTYRQVANLHRVFANKSSIDIKSLKSHLSKMIQSGRFLGRLLSSLLKTGLPLMENVIKPLARSVLIPLGLTAATSTADAGMQKKILGSGTTRLIISNDEMEGIIKIIKYLEDSSLLLKGAGETIQNETKEQKGGILGMLFRTLGASI